MITITRGVVVEKLISFALAGHHGNHAHHGHAFGRLDLDQLDLRRRSCSKKTTSSKLFTDIVSKAEQIHRHSLARFEGIKHRGITLIDPDGGIRPGLIRRIHDLDVRAITEHLDRQHIDRVEFVGVRPGRQLWIEIRCIASREACQKQEKCSHPPLDASRIPIKALKMHFHRADHCMTGGIEVTIRDMSVEMNPPELTRPVLDRPLKEVARGLKVDPRVPALVPGFDAPFFQAGLAGYSDGAMRLVARTHGCPFCITEALLDVTLINGGKGRTREDPDLLQEACGTGELEDNIAAGGSDHPLAGQIMGTEPETMAKAASLLVEMKYDVIDVNLACPVKKIRKRHRGGHLLTVPKEAIAILEAVREVVPESIPVTVKMRRAFDETDEMADNFERIFTAAYDIGYSWVTVHCRTVQQKYKGPGRWPFLKDLVSRHPEKLIFGSGDIWTVEDIFLMLAHTGVHGVSVARGCIGNPWIFRQARCLMAGEPPLAPQLHEQRQALLEHFHLSARLHGEQSASRQMRKFGIKFSHHHPDPEAVRSRFISVRSIAEWHAVLDEFYPVDEPTAG